MPTLLVYGREDKVIPPGGSFPHISNFFLQLEMTEDLLPFYASPHTTFVHPLGHFIPSNTAAKAAFREFIGQFLPQQEEH